MKGRFNPQPGDMPGLFSNWRNEAMELWDSLPAKVRAVLQERDRPNVYAARQLVQAYGADYAAERLAPGRGALTVDELEDIERRRRQPRGPASNQLGFDL